MKFPLFCFINSAAQVRSFWFQPQAFEGEDLQEITFLNLQKLSITFVGSKKKMARQRELKFCSTELIGWDCNRLFAWRPLVLILVAVNSPTKCPLWVTASRIPSQYLLDCLQGISWSLLKNSRKWYFYDVRTTRRGMPSFSPPFIFPAVTLMFLLN